MCQCRFIHCNKCTTPMGDADDGGVYACIWGQKVYGQSLYPPLNFAMTLKPL